MSTGHAPSHPYSLDPRVVLALDAGGTKFHFIALQGGREVAEPLVLPSESRDLDACLRVLERGFREMEARSPQKPSAISFAFPGPADYPNGVIGDCYNLPAFRGGVPLGPWLERCFNLPVFINNDGDLFAYGEAMAGFLPYVNGLLEQAGNPKRFRNLLGVTFGTGFGGGLVLNGRLHLGDNACGSEVWLLHNLMDPGSPAEETISIRGIRRIYAQEAGLSLEAAPEPAEIFEIASGHRAGNVGAAQEAYRQLGVVAGEAMANALTLVDGLAVIGGGLSGAASLFLPHLVAQLNVSLHRPLAESVPRLFSRVFNLEDPEDVLDFVALRPGTVPLPVPGTSVRVPYDPHKRIGVGLSRLGTSRAAALGAYAFALDSLDGRSGGRQG